MESRDARGIEVAEKMGISLSAYHRILKDASGHKVFSIEDLVPGSESVTDGLSEGLMGPLEDLEMDEFKRSLAKSVASLPEREQLVMTLYYDEELNLREIGAVLNVSESRVCQIHSQALLRLKSRMSQWSESE